MQISCSFIPLLGHSVLFSGSFLLPGHAFLSIPCPRFGSQPSRKHVSSQTARDGCVFRENNPLARPKTIYSGLLLKREGHKPPSSPFTTGVLFFFSHETIPLAF
jgi:hypothetical protein